MKVRSERLQWAPTGQAYSDQDWTFMGAWPTGLALGLSLSEGLAVARGIECGYILSNFFVGNEGCELPRIAFVPVLEAARRD